MPAFGPIKRSDLIYYLRKAGFEGPEAGGRHSHMRKDTFTLPIPNPHQGEISRGLLSRILREAKIDRTMWESL